MLTSPDRHIVQEKGFKKPLSNVRIVLGKHDLSNRHALWFLSPSPVHVCAITELMTLHIPNATRLCPRPRLPALEAILASPAASLVPLTFARSLERTD